MVKRDMQAVSTLDAFLQRLQDAFFGILFVIQKHDHSHGNTWPVIEAVVDHLQDLTFPISHPFFPWQPEIHWLAKALEWASPEIFVSGDLALGSWITELIRFPVSQLEGTTGIFEGLLIALGLTITNAVWVGWAFSQNRFPVIWPLKTLRITLVLFATVLYIPALTIFVSFVAHCHDNCTSGSKLVVNVITVAITVVFILIVLAVSATFFDPDPKENIESRAHSRVHVAYIAGRTLLVVLHTTLRVYGDPTSAVNQWILAIACVMTSVSLAWMSLWYMPYYSVRYSMLRTSLNFNFAAASLSNVYNLIRPGSDVGIIMLCFVMPMSAVLSYLCSQTRQRMIEDMPAEKASALTLELKVRSVLRRKGLLYRACPKANLTLANASPGDLGYDQSGGNAADTAETIAREEEQRTIRAVYEIYLKRLREDPQNPFLLLLIGSFQLLQLGNKMQCLNTYEKAATVPSLRFDEAFLIFRRKRLLQDESGGSDAISVIAIGQSKRLAKKYERRAATAVLQFWAELRQKRPQLHRLQKHGRVITSAVSAAQEHFLHLMRMSPTSPNPYRMYGSFLVHVVNDRDAGQKLLDHADELEESRGSKDHEDQDGEPHLELDMLSDNNGLFTISGNYEDIGTSDVLHKNISIIIPSPFAEVHDDVLRNYLDTGYAKVIDRPRQVFGLHSSGYLIRISLLVKQMPEEGGRQNFLGITNQVPQNPHEEYLIVSFEGTVLHFTKGITQLFGTLPKWRREPEAQMPKLWDWMPGLDAQRLKDSRGRIKCIVVPKQQENQDETVEVTLTASEITIRGIICYICRLLVSPVDPQQLEMDIKAGEALPARQCPFARESPADKSVLSLTTASVEAMPLSFSKHSLNDVPKNVNHAMPGPRRQAFKHHSDTQSSASGSRGAKSEKSFLRSLIALRNETSAKRLRWLTGVLFLSILIISVLAIVTNVVYSKQNSAAEERLEHIRSHLSISLLAVGAADAARTMQLVRAVGENRTGVFEDGLAINQLITAVAALKTLLLESTAINAPLLGREVWELVTTLTAKMSYVLASHNNDTTVDEHIEYARANAGTGLLTAFNASAAASMSQLSNDRSSTTVGISIAGPLVFLVLFLGFAWPMYITIENYRDQFLKLFLDIPHDVVAAIYEEHMQRLMEGEEQDDDESGDEIDAGRRLLERSVISDALPGSEPLSGRMDLVDNNNGGGRRIAFCKRLRDPHLALPKGSLVFGLCVFYFVSAGVLVSRFAESAKTRGRQLFWAGQQPVLIRQIDTAARDIYVSGAGLSTSLVTAMQAATMLNTLREVHGALVYGSERLGIPADIVAQDSTYKSLLYQTACTAGSPVDCKSFNGGILSQGLHAALDWYAEYVEVIMASPVVDAFALEKATILIRALDYQYFPASLEYLISAQTMANEEDMQWFRIFHLTSTVVFVCAMALAYLVLFRPLVQRLAEDSNRTHLMMMMCPSNVLGKLEVVRQWMEDAGYKTHGDKSIVRRNEGKDKEGQTEKKVAIAQDLV
ncbi:hypothetical protein HDU86_002818 [Geranomyces michiganensis]|nr:hypothetical protein HDU86_002818 [Geranomyces michiganensis]